MREELIEKIIKHEVYIPHCARNYDASEYAREHLYIYWEEEHQDKYEDFDDYLDSSESTETFQYYLDHYAELLKEELEELTTEELQERLGMYDRKKTYSEERLKWIVENF